MGTDENLVLVALVTTIERRFVPVNRGAEGFSKAHDSAKSAAIVVTHWMIFYSGSSSCGGSGNQQLAMSPMA